MGKNKREGKGIKYYANGDKEIGDYSDNKPIGDHKLFKNNGEILIIKYID